MAASSPVKALDSDALVLMNDAADRAALLAKGSLTFPTSSNLTATFDLKLPCREREQLIEEFWRFHPRYVFLKSLVSNARFVDVGAGSGGLIGWKTWGEPTRPDISMYALDRAKGEHFDSFVDFDIVDFEREECKFPDNAFDAALCSHVLDFVHDREALARETVRICRPGGRIYVEWPNSETDRILSRFALSPFDIACGTLSIEDDPDQVASVSRDEAVAVFAAAGAKVVGEGEICNDFLSNELFRCGVFENDAEVTTYGLVLALRLSRYLLLEKE